MKREAIVAIYAFTMLFPSLPVAAQEKITLNIYAISLPDGSFSPYDDKKAIIDNFMRDNPDIQVNLIPAGSNSYYDGYLKTIQKMFSEKKEPDIFYDWGRKDMREYVQKGQLLDLTDDSGRLSFSRAAKDAMSFQGKLYGVAPLWEIAGLYINETKLKELGLAVPKTLDELEKTADSFSAHGTQPFACGSRDKWPLTHIYGYLVERYAVDQFDKAVFERSIRFDSEPFAWAALKVQEWAKRGYFGKNPTSEDYQKAMDLMWKGQAGMMVSGTWLSADFLDEHQTSQSFGFYPFPVMADGKENGRRVIGMPNIAYVASKNASKKKDAVLRFFTYVLNKEAYGDNNYGASSVPGVVNPNRLINMGHDILMQADHIRYWWEQDLPKDLHEPFRETVYAFLKPETDVKAALAHMEDLLTQRLGPVKK